MKIHGLLLSAASPFLSNIFSTTFSPNLEHTVEKFAHYWMKKHNRLGQPEPLGVIAFDTSDFAGAAARGLCTHCGLSLSASLWRHCPHLEVPNINLSTYLQQRERLDVMTHELQGEPCSTLQTS